MDANAKTTPEQRLAIERKEFGEFGGVNASVEVSTTFTGANVRGACLAVGCSSHVVLASLGMLDAITLDHFSINYHACKLLCKAGARLIGSSQHA